MTDSHTVGLQSSAIALMRVPLKRLVVPAVAIFTSGSMAGGFSYFVVAPPPVSPTEASATGGQWRGKKKAPRFFRPSHGNIVENFPPGSGRHWAPLCPNAPFKKHSPPHGGACPIPKEASPATPLALSKRTTPFAPAELEGGD